MVQLKLKNAVEEELINEWLNAGVISMEDLRIKEEILLDLSMTPKLLENIESYPYSEENLKKLTYLKSIKNIAKNYKYSLALSRHFLRNKDYISAHIQFQSAYALSPEDESFERVLALMQLIKNLAQKKNEASLEKLETQTYQEIFTNISKDKYEQIQRLLPEKNITVKAVKKNREELLEIIADMILENTPLA